MADSDRVGKGQAMEVILTEFGRSHVLIPHSILVS